MIKKRTRKELYDKFRQGAIPSGADFADFIRSQVNLTDDGLGISDDPEEPINIRAKGEEENLLDFSDPINRKRWRISGRSADLLREGFNIKAEDRTNLFIERETGRVGIDTDKPEAKLHIKQINSKDAIRIDDEGEDASPFVITSEGDVGLGIGAGNDRPEALLHINSKTGTTDVMRVGNKQGDKNHLAMNNGGSVSLGYKHPNPNARLSIDGAVTIGSNTENPGDGGLYVKGNVIVDGNILFDDESGGGGIELRGNLTSTGEDVEIHDNVRIKAGSPEGSDGNLYVQGDSALGTYNGQDPQTKVIVNGHIESGKHPDVQSSEIQKVLKVNKILSINREIGEEQVTITGPLDVLETSRLGNNSSQDHIYLNGTVQREGAESVRINDSMYVTGDSSVKSAEVREHINVKGNADLKNLILEHGVRIKEFSQDGALAGNSNSAVPTEHAVKEYVDILLAGSISAFAMITPPVGWLECNGQAISRTKYARLYNLIRTTYGSGNGQSTFNLPDLRDEFIRGKNRYRNLGNKQGFSTQRHNHTFYGDKTNTYSNSHSHVNHYAYRYMRLIDRAYRRWWSGYFANLYKAYGRTWNESHQHTLYPKGSISHWGSSETRPQNIALLYCIKY